MPIRTPEDYERIAQEEEEKVRWAERKRQAAIEAEIAAEEERTREATELAAEMAEESAPNPFIELCKDKKFLDNIRRSRAVRRKLGTEKHVYFFAIYMAHYMAYEFAPFHFRMLDLSERENDPTSVFVSFRGSGKSTLMTTSFPLWAVMGKLQKKHVVIFAQTMLQARQHLRNIKEELESNELLRADLGPFRDESDEWRSYSLVIPKYDARITAVSIDQNVRGMRHGARRPDLIICDDIEDLASTRSQEMRDKTHRFVMSEIMPLGDRNTKYVFVGNLLHEDSLLMRLKKLIKEKKLDGVYREYPLVAQGDVIAWKGKYPSMEDVDAERRKTASEIDFQREYMLKIVPGDDWVVKPEWIHYYDALPPSEPTKTVIGVDLAITQAGDFTAMVTAHRYGHGAGNKMYILPDMLNERMDFPEQVTSATIRSLSSGSRPAELCIETVGYQLALAQTLKDKHIPVMEMKTGGASKLARLKSITHLIKSGAILFPRQGAELLIRQMVGFGAERHDDLADALVYAIWGLIESRRGEAIIAKEIPSCMKL